MSKRDLQEDFKCLNMMYEARKISLIRDIAEHAIQRAIKAESRVEKIEETLAIAKKYVLLTCQHAPGYDWNSDPLYLTRLQGDFLNKIQSFVGESDG